MGGTFMDSGAVFYVMTLKDVQTKPYFKLLIRIDPIRYIYNEY